MVTRPLDLEDLLRELVKAPAAG